jgi:hypothetical protein
MEKKFIKLVESNITRSTRGGFLVGDYIEIIKSYKSHEAYKNLHDRVKADLDDLVNSKMHLRVIGVNDSLPQRYLGNPESMTGNVILSIAMDAGGGRRYNNVLVHPDLCVVKDFYPNYAPFPDQCNYDNKEILQPKEVGDVESGAKGVTYALPTANVTIKVGKTKKSKIRKESYTADYLDNMNYFR